MRKIICSLLIVVVGCSTSSTTPGFHSIHIDEVITKLTNKESFILLVSMDNCYSCDMFEEEAIKVIEENKLIVYRLNYLDLNDEMKNQFELTLKHYDSWPVIINIQEGEVFEFSQYEYSQDPKGWKEWFRKQNLIKTN